MFCIYLNSDMWPTITQISIKWTATSALKSQNKHKITTTYADWNPGPIFWQAHTSHRNKTFNRITTIHVFHNWTTNGNTNKPHETCKFVSTRKNHSITKVNCSMYMNSTIIGSLELRSKLTTSYESRISLLNTITFRTNCLFW